MVAGQGFVEPILNPATGEVLTHIAEASTEQVEAAILAAHRAFASWSRTTPQQRSNLLLDIANAIEKNADLLAHLKSLNCGKPLHLARQDDLSATLDVFRFFADTVRCQTGQLSGEYLPGYTSMVRRDPIGVVASIAPWNMLVSEMPHGGLKRSGYGKDLSSDSLQDYSVVRHIIARHSREL